MFDYLANPARFMRIADRLFWPLVVIERALKRGDHLPCKSEPTKGDAD